MSYTDEEISNMIRRDKFPKGTSPAQKLAIRDLWLEGKDHIAFRKFRELLHEPTRAGKSLL